MLSTTYEGLDSFYGQEPDTLKLITEEKKPLRDTITSAIANATMAISGCVHQLNSLATYQPSFANLDFQTLHTHKSYIYPIEGFILNETDLPAIEAYLHDKPKSLALLAGLTPLIEMVYHHDLSKKVNIFDDPDTGTRILEVIIYSDLPVGEEFEEKDRLLFLEIQKAGLSEGLQYVVLSQG